MIEHITQLAFSAEKSQRLRWLVRIVMDSVRHESRAPEVYKELNEILGETRCRYDGPATITEMPSKQNAYQFGATLATGMKTHLGWAAPPDLKIGDRGVIVNSKFEKLKGMPLSEALRFILVEYQNKRLDLPYEVAASLMNAIGPK